MELPQIGPDIRIGGGKVVGGGAPAIAEGASSAFGEVDRQARSLMYWQGAQDRAMNLASGDAEYVIGSTKIFDAARGIQDPAVREKSISDSLQSLQTEIIKNHKPAADKLTEQLGIRYADDLHRMTLQSVELAQKNLNANLELVHDQTLVAASGTDNDKDRQVAIDRYQGVLDTSVKSGGLVPAEAEKKMFDFRYDLQKADYGKLAARDPVAALQVPLDKSGLKYTDWEDIQHMANTRINEDNSRGEQEFKGMKDQATLRVLNGQASDAEVNQSYKDGHISEEVYESHFHHPPSEPSVVAHVNGMIDGWTGSADSLRHYIATSIDPNPYYMPHDRAAIHEAASDKIAELKTAEGQNAADVAAQYKDTLADQYPEAFGSIFDLDPGQKVKLQGEINTFKANLRGKPIDVQNKMLAEEKKRIAALKAADSVKRVSPANRDALGKGNLLGD
jgi:hypothetical protein